MADILTEDEEHENAYRHLRVVIDETRVVFVQLLNFHLETISESYNDFIKRIAHELYHFCYPEECCQCQCQSCNNKCSLCKCRHIPRAFQKRILHPPQLDIFLDRSGPKIPGHDPAYRSVRNNCCCPIKAALNIGDLDVTLARLLLVKFTSVVQPGTQERQALDDLVEMRNNFAHAAKTRMSNTEYQATLNTKKQLLVLAKIYGKEQETGDRLDAINREPFNQKVCLDLFNTLLLQAKADQDLKENVNKLTEIVHDLMNLKTEQKLSEFIVKDIENATVIEGDDVTFEIWLKEKQIPVRWYRNDEEIVIDSDKMSVMTKTNIHILRIHRCCEEDKGSYAVNVNGTYRKAILDVKDYYTRNLRDIRCIEGESVTFDCEVINPDMKVQWYKDGIKYKTTGNSSLAVELKRHTLKIPCVELNDRGRYTIDIQNRTRSADLTVESYFKINMEDRICIEGETTSFVCEVIENNTTAKWLRDDKEIESSSRIERETSGRQHKLTLINTDVTDSGEYTVVVNNCKRKSTLLVKEYFTRNLHNITCIEGDDVCLDCEVIYSNMTGWWYKDGIRIESTSKVYTVEQNRHLLKIPLVEIDDNGRYEIDIQNRKRSADVTVTSYFVKTLDKIECREGEPITFVCEVIEDNKTAKWFLDDNEIQSSSRIKLETTEKQHKLTIVSTRPSDSGEYTAIVNNRMRKTTLLVEDTRIITNAYLDAIRTKREKRFYIRVMIVGKHGVGKSCLLRRLLGKGIDGVESTDGIDIYIHRCKIRLSDGQWIFDADQDPKREYAMRIKRTRKIESADVNEVKAISTKSQTKSLDNMARKKDETRTKIQEGESNVSMTVDRNPTGHQLETFLSKQNLQYEDNQEAPVINLEQQRPHQAEPLEQQRTQQVEPFDQQRQHQVEPLEQQRTQQVEPFDQQRQHQVELLEQQRTQQVEPFDQQRQHQVEPLEQQRPQQVEPLEQQRPYQLGNQTYVPKMLTERVVEELGQFLYHIENYEDENQEYVEIAFWDFAGEKDYYGTHHVFLDPHALYLLVSDCSEDIQKTEPCVTYDSIGGYIDFWFNTIHNCTDVEDVTTGKLDPPIIAICTGQDKLTGEVKKKKEKYRQGLSDAVQGENKRKHLRDIYFVSNTEPSDADFNHVRELIFKYGQGLKSYGETIPLKWIRLEQALDVLRESDINIVSRNDVIDLSVKCDFIEDRDVEVESFLKHLHTIGRIIYYSDLKDFVILSQQWLADAFKCLVSDKIDNSIKLSDEWTRLEKTGILEMSLIYQLFQKNPELTNEMIQDHVVSVLNKFDVIGINYKEGQQLYYMPYMITSNNSPSLTEIYEAFDADKSQRTPWLCLEFDFFPMAFFTHVMLHFVRNYTVCSDRNLEKRSIYHGVGVFFLDETEVNKFIVLFCKNTIAMQVWCWNSVPKHRYIKILEEMEAIIINLKTRYKAKNLRCTVKLKCSKGDINIRRGRINHRDLLNKTKDTKDGKYFCDDHHDYHDSTPLFNTWFYKYSDFGEQFHKRRDETDTESLYTKMCQFCVSNPKQSVYWCTECTKALCPDCNVVHRTQPTTSTHTVDMTQPPSSSDRIHWSQPESIHTTVLASCDYNYQIEGIFINDIAGLCEGEIVIGDINGKQLITCDIKGHNKQCIPLAYVPYRLTVIDINNVAVTTDSYNVLIVDVKNKTVTQQIDMNTDCWGIMYKNNNLYVGCEDQSLVVLDMSGKVIRTISLGCIPLYICSGTGGRVYCIDYLSHTLYCIDTEGNTVFTVANPDMSGTTGITTDNEGHALVVCYSSDNVHKISPDGKQCSVIITGIPHSTLNFSYICYEAESKSIVIGRYDNIYVYKI